MSKLVTLLFATALISGTVGFWLNPMLTSAGASAYPIAQVPVSDLHRNLDMRSMPTMKVFDQSFVFASP